MNKTIILALVLMSTPAFAGPRPFDDVPYPGTNNPPPQPLPEPYYPPEEYHVVAPPIEQPHYYHCTTMDMGGGMSSTNCW
jgi:hypothetical protein